MLLFQYLNLGTLAIVALNSLTASILLFPLLILVSPPVLLSFLLVPSLTLWFLYKHCAVPIATQSSAPFAPITLAHRGGQPLPLHILTHDDDKGTQYLPAHAENSMTAFKWAAQQPGADGIELDVWLTKDGHLVVIHDEYVCRLTSSVKNECVSECTLAQLRALNYRQSPKTGQISSISLRQGTGNAKTTGSPTPSTPPPPFDTTQNIPTLQEVIEWMRATQSPQFKLMIEVKEKHRRQACAQALHNLYTANEWLYAQAFVAAFDPLNIYLLRQLNRRVVTAFLCTKSITWYAKRNAQDMGHEMVWYLRYATLAQWLWDATMRYVLSTSRGLHFLGASFVCMDQCLLSLDMIRHYREHGIAVCCWTVNSIEQKMWFQSQGVSVISDFHLQKDIVELNEPMSAKGKQGITVSITQHKTK